MDFKTYLHKTYSAWLCKNIGIRLGSPIENFTHEEIVNTYKEINDYVVDYGVFASDDDSNGPRFFVKAIEEDSDNIIYHMKNAILNYVRDNHGFFWWGGKGISTEHTAYLNLKSNKDNSNESDVLLTQIGGQIFSDCWGYVSLGNPDVACDLASKMSSITHGKDGVEGAKFVACAISIAYSEDSIYRVINKALNYLDKNSKYFKSANEIIDFYNNDKDKNYSNCFNYIIKNHPYEKYGGICPIITNSLLMIASMLYGENNFNKTMSLLATSGFDTDCNLGNVGSIMGALLGVENIDDKWIKPINDLIIFSSSLGSLNIDTISNTAYEFCKLAYKLNNKEIPCEYLKDENYTVYDFKLLKSTQSFKVRSNRYSETNLLNFDGKLRVIINNGYKNYNETVYMKSYYLADEIYDFRYEPVLSSTVYGGETIYFKIINNINVDISIYVKDVKGNIYESERFNFKNEKEISYKIPNGIDCIILEYGIKIYYNEKINCKFIEIVNVKIDRNYDYILDFKNEFIEDRGFDFLNNHNKSISSIVQSYGTSSLFKDYLQLDGMIIFSDYKASVKNLTFEFEGNNVVFCFDVKGINVYKGIKIEDEKLIYLERKNEKIYEKILSKKFLLGEKNILNIDLKYGRIMLDGFLKVQVKNLCKLDFGAVGIIGNNSFKIYKCKLVAY